MRDIRNARYNDCCCRCRRTIMQRAPPWLSRPLCCITTKLSRAGPRILWFNTVLRRIRWDWMFIVSTQTPFSSPLLPPLIALPIDEDTRLPRSRVSSFLLLLLRTRHVYALTRIHGTLFRVCAPFYCEIAVITMHPTVCTRWEKIGDEDNIRSHNAQTDRLR